MYRLAVLVDLLGCLQASRGSGLSGSAWSGRINLGNWICCQLGAREHYAVPRALVRSGVRPALVTDVWLPPSGAVGKIFGRINGVTSLNRSRGRYSADLGDVVVKSFNHRAMAFETSLRIRGRTGWDAIMDRNVWFQRAARDWLDRMLTPGSILFAYSYAALELLRLAKERGCRTVLGQIDPGIVEERIVAEEVARYPEFDSGFEPAPPEYWDLWREECRLADVIMVNSPWAARALAEDGVEAGKLRVVPLAYSTDRNDSNLSARTFPASFTADRPLRVLFLGQAIPRKGIFRLLDAAELLVNEPVEFLVIGEAGPLAEQLKRHRNVVAAGAVPRAEVHRYYSSADVFLFPTLSDGFGLTQLEAVRWGLPIICSDRCGQVVEHGVSGLVLDDVTGPTIAAAVQEVLRNPAKLREWSRAAAAVLDRFSLEHLGRELVELDVKKAAVAPN